MNEVCQNEKLEDDMVTGTGAMWDMMDDIKVGQNDIFLYLHKTKKGRPCRMAGKNVTCAVAFENEMLKYTIGFNELKFVFRCLRYELLPDYNQKEIINRMLARKVYVYNNMLNDEKEEYKKSGKCNINSYDNYKLNDGAIVDHLALRDVWWDVRTDLDKLFAKKVPFLPFKKKADTVQSYWVHRKSIVVKNNRIQLPVLNWVNCAPLSFVPEDTKPEFASIIRNAGQYSVVVAFFEEETCQTVK